MVGGGSTASRWLLVMVLLFGVAGMHHVPAAGHEGAAGDGHHVACCAGEAPQQHGGDHPPAPLSPHDLLHLCLAILGATSVGALILAMLAAAMVLVLLARPPTGSWPPRAGRARSRPPPSAVRLALVGVLRI